MITLSTGQIKVLPIIFNADMVKAVLNRWKNQTRRMNGLDQINENPSFWEISNISNIENDYVIRFKNKVSGEGERIKCPFGGVGTILYGRETLSLNNKNEWYYKATPEVYVLPHVYQLHSVFKSSLTRGYIPSIHVPKVAARIFLEVTSIHVERLADISEDDAIGEGIEASGYVESTRQEHSSFKDYMSIDINRGVYVPSESFFSLWIKINGSESIANNPWVWVVKFKVIDRPTNL